MIGPMFRYDRPQAGRYRQFWQFDVEAIGDPGPAVDAEIIELGAALLSPRSASSGVEVLVNSIGDPACRPAYLEALAGYYRGHARGAARARARPPRAEPAPAARLEGPGDGRAERRARRGSRTTCATPARRTSRLSAPTSRRSASPYRVEPGLVRGLDYYTRTAFEFYVAGARGPAAGARRRRPLRRPRGAPGRAADARDRVRAWARPGRARPRRAGPGRRADRRAAWTRCRGRRRRDPADTAGRLADRHRAAGGGPRAPARTSATASSAASWRPPAGTGPTSRSSSATSSPTARSASAT